MKFPEFVDHLHPNLWAKNYALELRLFCHISDQTCENPPWTGDHVNVRVLERLGGSCVVINPWKWDNCHGCQTACHGSEWQTCSRTFY